MSWRVAYGVVFAFTLAVYGTMVIWTLPAISAEAGGLAPFDLRLTGYSGDEAREFLTALSDAGRATYQGPQRLLDMAYPALLGLVLAGGFLRLVTHQGLRWILILFVLGGMIADYTENTLVAQMLTAKGVVSDTVVATAARATLIKSALTGTAMICMIVALGLAGARRRRAQ